MAERGPPAPKLPISHKPMKTTATDQGKITDPSQQNPQPEPEVIVPPGQVPDPAPPNPQDPPVLAPPVHIPDPVQPQNPPVHLPNPMQPQNPPTYVPNPVLPPAPPVKIPQLNWSYFKLEFSGKPEDVEAHLWRTNDWTETHNFAEVAKVQRFCLTLTGKARLWYETLRPIVVGWTGLQEWFRQQYSKFGNTSEQLFHVWRSFHYDENTETIDAYVNRMKPVAVLLNYGESQILELFKTHYLVNYIGFYVQLNNLKRCCKKFWQRKIDKQLSGQSGATKSIHEGRRHSSFK